MPSLWTEIDHVGFAVRDLGAAIRWYSETLGATVSHREVVERDGIEEALLPVADSFVQLLSPTRSDSPVQKFLDSHGEGIHHIAYRVDDCAAAIAQARDAGAQMIDEVPRPGSRNTTVAFMHPHSGIGALVEFVQV